MGLLALSLLFDDDDYEEDERLLGSFFCVNFTALMSQVLQMMDAVQ